MADPLSITAAALGISQVALAVSKKIYSSYKGLRGVNDSVKWLQHRTSNISQILENLGHTVEKSNLVLHEEDNHQIYKAVNDSVISCRVTVFKLRTKLHRVEEPKTGIKQGWRFVTMGMMQQDIDAILSEMDTHAVNLQLSLQILNVSISAASGNVVRDIQLHIEKLERMILVLDGRSKTHSLTPVKTGSALPHNILLDENTASLRHTANSIISSASTVALRSEVGDAIGSLPDSGEPAFQYFGNDTGHEQIQDSTSGSELGKTLDISQKQHIQGWIPEPPMIDEKSEPGSSSSKIQEPNLIFTSADLAGNSNPSETTVNPMSEALDESEDDDVEFQVAQRLLSRGAAEFTKKQYEEALESIKIGLLQAQHFGMRKKEILGLSDMQLQLAICYLRTGALILSEELLLAATKEPVRDEKSKERVLCAFHNLSHLHLKKRNFEAAESHCRQALTGRGKMPSIGKSHDDYFLSLRLRALIFWAKGDKRQAEVCVELLPEDKRLVASEFDQILKDEFREISDSPVEQDGKFDASPSPQQPPPPKSSGTIKIDSGQLKNVASWPKVGENRRPFPFRRISDSPLEQESGSDVSSVSKNPPTNSSDATKTGSREVADFRVWRRDRELRRHFPDSWSNQRNNSAQEALRPILRPIKRHSRDVLAVNFSPATGIVTSGSADCIVKQWNVATGASERTIDGPSHLSFKANAIAFSPDGRLVAAGFHNRTVMLWDMATGRDSRRMDYKPRFFETGGLNIWSVAFSPDSRLVASGSADQTVRLWDLATEACRIMKGHSKLVGAVAFSLDGLLIASGSDDCTVRLWDAVTGSSQNTLKGHLTYVRAVAFSPDGRLVASGSSDGTLRLWDVATGQSRRTINGHSDLVRAIAFSPDGELIASGSDDHTVKLWHAATGRKKHTIKGHSDSVRAVAFSPNGLQVASGSNDCTVGLWDVATGNAR